MGRKVHPLGFRLGYIKDWQSRWFSERNYTDQLHEDLKLRRLVMKRFEGAGVARVEIERSANRIEITVHTAKVGVVVGKGGEKVDEFRKILERSFGKKFTSQSSSHSWWPRASQNKSTSASLTSVQ